MNMQAYLLVFYDIGFNHLRALSRTFNDSFKTFFYIVQYTKKSIYGFLTLLNLLKDNSANDIAYEICEL